MEGAPQHHPDLVTYIKQLHLMPPASGPYHLQQPNVSDFSQNGQSRRVASILGGKVRILWNLRKEEDKKERDGVVIYFSFSFHAFVPL